MGISRRVEQLLSVFLFLFLLLHCPNHLGRRACAQSSRQSLVAEGEANPFVFPLFVQAIRRLSWCSVACAQAARAEKVKRRRGKVSRRRSTADHRQFRQAGRQNGKGRRREQRPTGKSDRNPAVTVRLHKGVFIWLLVEARVAPLFPLVVEQSTTIGLGENFQRTTPAPWDTFAGQTDSQRNL